MSDADGKVGTHLLPANQADHFAGGDSIGQSRLANFAVGHLGADRWEFPQQQR